MTSNAAHASRERRNADRFADVSDFPMLSGRPRAPIDRTDERRRWQHDVYNGLRGPANGELGVSSFPEKFFLPFNKRVEDLVGL